MAFLQIGNSKSEKTTLFLLFLDGCQKGVNKFSQINSNKNLCLICVHLLT